MTLTDFARTRLSIRNRYNPDWDSTYSVFLDVDSSEDIVDLPIMLKWYYDNISLSKDRIVIPLYEGTIINRKQSSTMINDFIRRPFYNKLTAVKSNKGHLYYGNSGLIMDSDRHILFLSCIRIDKESPLKSGQPVYYIAPDVFHNDGLLHKAIAKNILPAITDSSPYNRRDYIINISTDIDEKFLTRPAKPSISLDTDKVVADIVKNNIDSIFYDN